MIYNDFKILDDEQYKILSEQYSTHTPVRTQTELANAIFVHLDECKSYCFGLHKNVNKRVCAVLKKAKDELERLIGNINSVFKITATKAAIVNEFNLFEFAKKLIKTIELTDELFDLSSDANHVKFINTTIKTISQLAQELFEALEQSNIQMFKYM